MCIHIPLQFSHTVRVRMYSYTKKTIRDKDPEMTAGKEVAYYHEQI